MADNNPFPGENNTGHIWDNNIRELKNPVPRWWMMAFWASIIWFFVYGIIYPMYPTGAEPTKGVIGWTQIKEYQEGVAEVNAIRAPFEAKIAKLTAAEILKDPDLTNYTLASAKVLFGDNCAACHGSGGQGGPGFPVLVDDNWIYGGDINTIQQSITMGRKGMMPKMGGNQLSQAEIDQLAQSIVAGKVASEPLFTQKGCLGCHGPDAKGMKALGSANLTDAVWRFSEADQLASVKYTVTHGVNDPTDPATRQAEMPVFSKRLKKDEIKKLAVYAYSLGGGQ